MKKIFTLFIIAILGSMFSQKTDAQSTSLTNRAVYDFQVGDVIHKEYDEQNYSPDSPAIINYIIDSVVSKNYSVQNTSVQYVINRKYVNTLTPAPLGYVPTLHQTIDTVTYTDLDSIPKSVLGLLYCNQLTTPGIVSEDFNLCNDSVWSVVYGHPYICGHSYVCFAQLNFYKGLGGPYYNATSNVTNIDRHLNIMFYKKGPVICGTRFDLSKYATGIEDLTEASIGVNIYPNPTQNDFTISKSNTEVLGFNLYNLIGQKILNTQLSNQTTAISKLNLAKGAYLFNFTNIKGKVLKNRKINC